MFLLWVPRTLSTAPQQIQATYEPPINQPHPLEVMDDVCRVPTTKLGHGDVDAFIVLLKVDLHIFLQLHPSPDLGGQGVFVEHATVEEVISGQLRKVRGETDGHTG